MMYGRTAYLACKRLFYSPRELSVRRISGVIVRHSTLEDYHGVVDLSKEYETDYIPYRYRDFITDPDYTGYVCEVDKEIIGFGCTLLHDDGLAIQGQAARVKSDHRGKGYNMLIYEHILDDARKLTTARSLITINYQSSINLATLPSFVTPVENGTEYMFQMSRPKCSFMYPSWSIVRINEADLRKVFDSPSVCRLLFPHGSVYSKYTALGMYKSNIRHICSHNSTMFVTTSTETKKPEPKDIRLFTTGWRYGHHCSISVFGKYPKTLSAHVQAHVNEVTSSCDLSSMTIYTAEGFPCEAIQNVFEQFGTGQLKSYDLCTLSMDLDSPIKNLRYSSC